MVRKADLMEEKMRAPPVQSDSVAAEATVELGLEIEEALDALVRTRGEARRELLRAIGFTSVAALSFCIEAWATWRGEPVFGWFLFVLFTGFAVFFWSRRRGAEEKVGSLDEDLRLLEAKRSNASDSDSAWGR